MKRWTNWALIEVWLTFVSRFKFPIPVEKQSGNKSYLCYQNSLSDDYELVDDEDERTPNDQDAACKAAEQWSEIPLNSMTESNSTTSSYSQHSDGEANNEASGTNEKDSKDDEKKQSGTGFSDWISKNSFRRQSLEDVFAQSNLFGKFGRSERRNSESEVETSSTSSKKDFFLFNRHEDLTDSQIENLFLPPEHL